MSSHEQDGNPQSDSARQLAETAVQLQTLRPVAGGVNRDQVMFAAGHAAALAEVAARRRLGATLWPLATAALLLVNVSLAGLWWQSRASENVNGPQLAEKLPPPEAVVPVNIPLEPLKEVFALQQTPFLAMRAHAVAGDWDGFELASGPMPARAQAPVHRSRQEWLTAPVGSLP